MSTTNQPPHPADDAATQAAEQIRAGIKIKTKYADPAYTTTFPPALKGGTVELPDIAAIIRTALTSATAEAERKIARLKERVTELCVLQATEFRRPERYTEIRTLRADLATALQRVAALESENAAQAEALRVKDKALTECIECAAAIHRNIDDEVWTETQDPLWVPTIHAHATVIWQDARQALSTAPATAAKAKETL